MEHRRIRKVQVVEPRDVWFKVAADSERIHLDTLFGQWTIVRAVWTPKLLYWGGLASMIGGVLWMVLILVPHLNYVMSYGHYFEVGYEEERFINTLSAHLDRSLLALPLALFLVGLLGLYAGQWKTPRRLGTTGFILASVGLVLTIINTLYPRWLQVLYGYIVPNGFDGLFAPPPPIWYWLSHTWFGFLIMSIGLSLLGFSMLRTKALPIRVILLFIFSTLGMFPVPIIFTLVASLMIAGFGPDRYEVWDTLQMFDSFTIMTLLFGASWVWLGNVLLAQRFGALPRQQYADSGSSLTSAE